MHLVGFIIRIITMHGHLNVKFVPVINFICFVHHERRNYTTHHSLKMIKNIKPKRCDRHRMGVGGGGGGLPP